VRSVIESIWQIGHTNKSPGVCSCKIGKCKSASARIGSIDDSEGNRMDDPLPHSACEVELMIDPRKGLESAVMPFWWTLNFIWDTIRLMFWFFMPPTLIIAWCFYHPAEGRVYFVSAIPLLWNGDVITRGVLVFFVLLIASLFGKTMHMICRGIIKLALVAGVIWYTYMIFKLA
jgi:hypothetical protein